MSKHPPAPPEEKAASVFGDSYDGEQFKKDLTAGQIRWPATFLAALNAGLLASDIFFSDEPEMFFPFHLKGAAVLWLLSTTLLVWSAVAFVNWRAWASKKRAGARP